MKLFRRSDKIFFFYFCSLALPVALQNLITNLLNTMDILMIGSFSEAAIAGVGLANKIFFLYQLVTFGVFSGASIFLSQYWGKKDILGIKSVSFIQILGAVSIGLIFTVPCLLFPEFIIGLFSADPNVVQIGAGFLRIVSLCYIPSGISMSYYFVLRSTQNAPPCLYISSFSVVLNGILNYLLIFGAFGFPRLGVLGSATATVIARLVELAIVIIVIKKYFKIFDISRACIKNITSSFMKKFLNSTIPVLGNEAFWALGVVLYSVIFARMGTEAVASTSIATSLESLLSVFFFGIASASGIIIGKKIGQRKEHHALQYAYKFSVIVPALTLFVSVFGIMLAPYVLSFYNISDSTKANTYTVFLLICLFLPFRNFNLVNIVGTLRNGGDTKFCLFIDLVGVWLIALPGAFISGLVFHASVGWVYFFILLEEIVKVVVIILRFRTKIWINNLVH